MIVAIVVCIAAMFGLQLVVPAWWWTMVVPFFWCLWREDSGWRGFLIGALSASLLWLGGSLFYLTTSGELIAQRVAAMVQVGSPVLLTIIVVVVAALAGGLAGCTGGLLRAAFRTK